jgi:hypothetical protein
MTKEEEIIQNIEKLFEKIDKRLKEPLPIH